jgi:hypothetical protein
MAAAVAEARSAAAKAVSAVLSAAAVSFRNVSCATAAELTQAR